jgi:hypothetical protein
MQGSSFYVLIYFKSLVVTVKVDSLDIYMLFSRTRGENTISVRLTGMFYLHISHFVPKQELIYSVLIVCYLNRAKGCHIDLLPGEVF